MPDIGACYLEEDVLDLCRTAGGGHASEGLFLSFQKATVAHLSCVVFARDAARSPLKGRKPLHAPKEQTHTHTRGRAPGLSSQPTVNRRLIHQPSSVFQF